jgi:hypothetical protein
MGYKKKGGKLKKMMGGGTMGKTMMEPNMMKKGGKTKKMMGGGTMGRTMMKPNMMYKKGGKGKK